MLHASKNRTTLILGSVVFIPIVLIGLYLFWMRQHPAHQHCIRCAAGPFVDYAYSHGGNYPVSERGWGDALLELVKDPELEFTIRFLVGVDDDGSILKRALKTGEDVQEDRCTRIYVQGLTDRSPGSIALLFDRHAVGGGDHGRSLFAEPLREVLTVDLSHTMIKESVWPEYVQKQRRLLLNEGFTNPQIDGIYASTILKMD